METNTENITRKKFNNLKKYYDETWDSENHTLHVGLFNREKSSLEESYVAATDYLVAGIMEKKPISEASIVLDVGCGAGRTLIDLCVRFGCQGVGVDISDEQIKDARNEVQKVNRTRLIQGLPKIKIKFLRVSGSDLSEIKENERFSHVISQDAILLVEDKRALFESVQRLLIPGGLFAAADFLSESGTAAVSDSEKKLVYDLVNWSQPLSYEMYQDILQQAGLLVDKAERRDADMIKTYDLLAQKMKLFADRGDTMYAELMARYRSIVDSVKQGKMGWGFFYACKPSRKTVLIAGTKEKSIGRFIATQLHAEGWDVWLYSRNARRVDAPRWHERMCDISSEKGIKKLISEITDLNLVMMLADSGGAHESLEDLSGSNIKGFINAKLVGSVLLSKAVIAKFGNRQNQLKMVWCAGKTGNKVKNLILYGMVNSGLAAFVDSLNQHYAKSVQAYYLPTGLISPSTLGDAYVEHEGEHLREAAQHPQKILDRVRDIIEGNTKPGMFDAEVSH